MDFFSRSCPYSVRVSQVYYVVLGVGRASSKVLTRPPLVLCPLSLSTCDVINNTILF